MAGFFTRKHRYITTALKLRRLAASFLSECGCSFPSIFFGVAALSVFALLFGGAFLFFLWCGWWLSFRFFAHPCFSWWCCLFLSLCVVRLGWCCVFSSSVWVVLRLLLFRLGGAASSLLPFGWCCVLSSCCWWCFLSPLLGGAHSRSPAPQMWEKHNVQKGG